VRFEGQTIHVDVKYDVQSNDPGCEVFGDDQPTAGGVFASADGGVP
jgi:hypothetical protein